MLRAAEQQLRERFTKALKLRIIQPLAVTITSSANGHAG